MSGKYPSLSPYVYCTDNPMRCVDPNGEKVVIVGDDTEMYSEEKAIAAFDRMQQGTNLHLHRDDNGNVSIVGGKIMNDNDQKLYDAINNAEVTAKIIISSEMPDPDSEDGQIETTAGHCYGANYYETNNTSVATNYVNIAGLNNLELPGAEGSGMIHEVTEAFEIGKISWNSRSNIQPAYRNPMPMVNGMTYTIYSPDYGVYKICHSRATPDPAKMTNQEASCYKSPEPQNCLPKFVPKLFFK